MAALAASVAAIFSGYQAYIARDTEVVANRALVISDAFRLVTYAHPSKDQMWEASSLLENVGDTPTEGLRYREAEGVCVPKLAGFASAPQFKWRDASAASFAHALIGPKSAVAAFVIGFSDTGIGCPIAVAAKGVIKYADIFGYHHLVEYCEGLPGFVYADVIRGAVPAGRSLRIQGEECPEHNCEDEECGPDWERRARE